MFESKREFVYQRRLSSATKYPSILNYHKYGEKGALLEDRNVIFAPDEMVYAYEKVDGRNVRLIHVHCEDQEHGGVVYGGNTHVWFGLREDLLGCVHDEYYNLEGGVVEKLWGVANLLLKGFAPCLSREVPSRPQGTVTTFYFEQYGGKTSKAAKQYTKDRTQTELRLLDIKQFNHDILISDMNAEQLSGWRENDTEGWAGREAMSTMAEVLGVLQPPQLFATNCLGTSISEIHKELNERTTTQVAIGDATPGRSEGFVFRNADRSKIAKAKLANYDR